MSSSACERELCIDEQTMKNKTHPKGFAKPHLEGFDCPLGRANSQDPEVIVERSSAQDVDCFYYQNTVWKLHT